MLHRFLAALAVSVSLLSAPQARAALVTLPIDPAQSTTALRVEVDFAGTIIASANLNSRYTGSVVFDVQRDGLGQITSIQFQNPSTTVGTIVLEDITGINVDLGALGNVPATLDDAQLALAVRNLIGNPATGQTLSADVPINVAPSGISPLGDIIYSGNVGGQDITLTGGTALLGPATGPIGPALGPNNSTNANLVDPTGATVSVGPGNLILTDGITNPDRVVIPISGKLPGVLRLDSFFLRVDLILNGSITAVPEAGTTTMMGIASAGLLGAAGIRRFRRKSS